MQQKCTDKEPAGSSGEVAARYWLQRELYCPSPLE